MIHEKMVLPLVTEQKHKHNHRISPVLSRHTSSHDAGLLHQRRAPNDANPTNKGLWLDVDEFTWQVEL
jgi:hypothetical protein